MILPLPNFNPICTLLQILFQLQYCYGAHFVVPSTAYLFLILPGVVTPVPKLAPPLQRLASMLFNRQAWKLFFFSYYFISLLYAVYCH